MSIYYIGSSRADRDGTMDMVFTSCRSVDSKGVGSDCYINIAYNQQLPLCASTTDSAVRDGTRVCRQPNDLCIADDNFKFDLRDTNDNKVFIGPTHQYINTLRMS